MHFVHEAGGVWIFQTVTVLTHWKPQMEPAARGALEVASSSFGFQQVVAALSAH